MLKCMLHNLILGLIYYTACIMCSVNYIYIYMYTIPYILNFTCSK